MNNHRRETARKASRCRTEDDLRCSHEYRPTSKASHEPSRRTGTQIVEAGCFVRATFFQLRPHRFEANNLQTRVGGSMYRGEDFRTSISRSASHVRDSVKGKGCTRDRHHDTVGSHHFADDFSVHSCDAGESPHCSRFSVQASFAVSSEASHRNRAKIAPNGGSA